jgi:hypothetical protein
VAVPLQVQGREPAAVAAVHVSTDLDDAAIAVRLEAAASAIRAAL